MITVDSLISIKNNLDSDLIETEGYLWLEGIKDSHYWDYYERSERLRKRLLFLESVIDLFEHVAVAQ